MTAQLLRGWDIQSAFWRASEVSSRRNPYCFAAGFALADIIVSQMDRRGS